MTPQLRLVLATAAALIALPLALTGCSSPAPDATPTADAIAPEAKPTVAPDAPAAGFTRLVDDSGVVSVGVPDSWTDTVTAPLSSADGSVTVGNVSASPDLDKYSNGWDTPGVSVSATNDPTAKPQTFIDNITKSITDLCESATSGDYDDTVYVGTYLYFTNCGKTTTDFLAVIAQDAAKTHIVITTIQMISDDDKSTLRDEILNTFYARY